MSNVKLINFLIVIVTSLCFNFMINKLLFSQKVLSLIFIANKNCFRSKNVLLNIFKYDSMLKRLNVNRDNVSKFKI